MKRNIWKILAVCLCCTTLLGMVTGCAGDFEPTGTSGTETQPKETSPSAEPTDATDGIVYDPSTWPKVTEYTGSPIFEADPDREIYISLQNQDCDFYPGMVYTGAAFEIITKEYYKPEEIKIVFPGKTRYKTKVTERNDEFQHIEWDEMPGYNFHSDGQHLFHYLCLHHADLRTFAQMQSDSDFAGAVWNELSHKGKMTEEIFNDLDGNYMKPLEELKEQYMEAYTGQDKVTDYNAYSVNVDFDQKHYVDETIEYLDITIGEKTYRVEFGQWRIHANAPIELTQSPKGVKVGDNTIQNTGGDSPFGGGYVKTGWIRFSTESDIAVVGLRCSENSDIEILGAQIKGGAEDGSMDYLWDGKSPLNVAKGSAVEMSLYLYSDGFKEYEMARTCFFYVDYVTVSTGAKGTMAVPCHLSRHNRFWDTYCLMFLGVDLGEYYHYFPRESMQIYWLDELPESWRKE